MKVSRATKPHTIDVSEELGFKQSRIGEIGPGSHKPNMGRGGIPIPDSMYLGEDELNVKTKKGIGIGESVKQNKSTDKPSWSDLL